MVFFCVTIIGLCDLSDPAHQAKLHRVFCMYTSSLPILILKGLKGHVLSISPVSHSYCPIYRECALSIKLVGASNLRPLSWICSLGHLHGPRTTKINTFNHLFVISFFSTLYSFNFFLFYFYF